MSQPLLEVRDLKTYFPIKKGITQRTVAHVRAVDGVSFHVAEGETFGLVGESGCGKSTTGRSIVRFIPSTSGEILFEGQDITQLRGSAVRSLSSKMQIVFQDPFSSLDPRFTVRRILEEPLIIHKLYQSKEERVRRVKELMEMVGLPATRMHQYPNEFSGGQRQRIGIARAIAVNPRLIVADEPVSALDVSIQSQILNLLKDLQEQLNLTYVFIAHDLSVVKHISNRVGVMYLGKIVEMADVDSLYTKPLHPYSQALLSAVPIPKPNARQERIILQGDLPSPAKPPTGCAFHPRCRMCMDICRTERPEWKEVEPGHFAACHLYNEA